MAHDNQIYDSEEPEYEEPGERGAEIPTGAQKNVAGRCERCNGTGFPYREEQERGGAFRGVVYSRSSPVRCSCQK
jgi:hypothetical protein